MRKKTVLITGGAGFIGSHLCERLLNDGYQVICIDNFITGNLENIKPLLNDKNFSLRVNDITRYLKVREKIDYILHCASLASPADYLRFPIQTLKVGALGTHNTLGLAKEKKAVFMLFSTSEIYGDPLFHPQKETHWGHVNPVGLRSCYDESKRFAEALTMAYYRCHKLDTKIVRIFNTYGPKMRRNDGRVVPNFIMQAIKNRPLTIYGKGRQTRSFCFIDDLVEGICRLLLAKVNTPVNLGNPQEFTIIQLAKLILKTSGSASKLAFMPLPDDDPRQRQPDIQKAKKILGWKPKVRLEEGLKYTIAWFKG